MDKQVLEFLRGLIGQVSLNADADDLVEAATIIDRAKQQIATELEKEDAGQDS